jgi:hypothetical protein
MTVPAQPATSAPCPKCGSKRVGTRIDEAGIRTTWEYLYFSALICTVCGFSEIYIEHLEKLLKTIEKQYPETMTQRP